MGEERVLWSIVDLATYWGVSKQTVEATLRRGPIPGSAKVDGRWIFDKDVVLDNWIPKSVEVWQRKRGLPTLAVKDAKSAREVADKYFNYLAANVPLDRWLKIIVKAMDQAEEGDAKARSWLSNNLMGTPVQRVIAAVAVDSVIPEDKLAGVLETLLRIARGNIIDGEVVDVTGSNGADADAAQICSEDS